MCEYCEKANEEKAIEHLKKYPTNWIFPNVDKMAIDTVLELIEKQQAEIEKKDKIIKSIENLCVEKGDDENENYGGIVIWKFAVQIIDIIRERNKVEGETNENRK